MNQNAVKEFFDAWSLYDRVLDLNYMFHDEIYRSVAEALDGKFGVRPFSILDLGCGSARHLARSIRGRSVHAYRGYDLSQAALDAARANLQSLGCQADFVTGDFYSNLQSEKARYDLVFSCFSLHHLSAVDKQDFFKMARERVSDEGMLLIIDVARNVDEDRAVYLDHYCEWIQAEWSGLSQEELNFIFGHIRESDFPESDSELKSMAAEGGFRCAGDLTRVLWHHAWAFEPLPAQSVTGALPRPEPGPASAEDLRV